MKQQQLLSFHGKQEIKDKYVGRVKAHALADAIVQGQYWENGKGCAVGCTVHSNRHSAYEDELGIPRVIARLEDRIFEGLPNDEAKTFPLEFLEAIPLGVDLAPVWKKFLVWLLIDTEHGVINFTKDEKIKGKIQEAAKLIEGSIAGKNISENEVEELRQIARSAYAAADAAYAAAAAALRQQVRLSAKTNHYRVMRAKLIELLKAA